MADERKFRRQTENRLFLIRKPWRPLSKITLRQTCHIVNVRIDHQITIDEMQIVCDKMGIDKAENYSITWMLTRMMQSLSMIGSKRSP